MTAFSYDLMNTPLPFEASTISKSCKTAMALLAVSADTLYWLRVKILRILYRLLISFFYSF